MATSNLFCGICFEYYKSGDEILCSACGHVFHNNCFEDWLTRSSTCPDCCVTDPKTHRIFLHIDDPSLSKRKLLEQLEESEQNFLSMQCALTACENKCTELSNELQLAKAQIVSYELELKQTDAEDSIPSKDQDNDKDLEIARLSSLNSNLEKKLLDFKTRLAAIISEKEEDNNNVENIDVNEINGLVKIKQLIHELEIVDLVENFKKI